MIKFIKILPRSKKRLTITLVVFLFLSILIPHIIINKHSTGRTFDDLTKIQSNKTGLVLGTSEYLPNGRKNLYFTYRVNAAVNLYKAGKIINILVSGDNGRKEYDEPSGFKNALVELGIPSENIYLDYAGFRTLDSVVRAKEIFGKIN